MCGFVGYWSTPAGRTQSLDRIRRMRDKLVHRGPDDAGDWLDEPSGVALGFRRLSIVDLSPGGHQPMVSSSGRHVIAFNGEVYNFREIRKVLEGLGHRFAGGSDTEVILHAVEQWGVGQAVRRFIGMFAIALWDRRERQLVLIRDRLGIKPLYYGWLDGAFVFGSELKALIAWQESLPEIDRGALALFLRSGYIPSPHSIYKQIRKLPAGNMLTLRAFEDQSRNPVPYWSYREVAEEGLRSPLRVADQEAVERLELLLKDAVLLRMIADVPLGAFLSGGIDSSTVVALMQAQSERPVKTFSIGFEEAGFNEAVDAKRVAEHLGTEHTELYVTASDARNVIPRLPWMFDEPFSDPSQIPTYLLCELTRRYVTVSLSGDGGDELFSGYTRYRTAQTVWAALGWLPGLGRRAMGSLLRVPAPERYDRALGWMAPYTANFGSLGTVGHKLHALGEVLSVSDRSALYHRLTSQWKEPASVVPDAVEPAIPCESAGFWPPAAGFLEEMGYTDTVTYLPDDILVKVDRASMAVSLEARVPLVDHRVVEFAASLPMSLKRRGGEGKWILRQVLKRHVPPSLTERPKMGFGIPLDQWLRGGLRKWGEDLLDPDRLKVEGYFNPEPIRTKWREHLDGTRNWQYQLWSVLMFQAWLNQRS